MEIKNLGQLFQHLAAKAGVDPNDQNLINALSSSELSKISLHSDLVKSIDENLLSVTTAKDNHPNIKNHYHAQALNALDKKLDTIVQELGLSDEDADAIGKEKNSYKRLDLVLSKVQEKKSTAGSEDKSALQRQVEDLARQLKEADNLRATEVGKVEALRKSDKISYELRSMFGATKTVYDGLSQIARNTALMTVIAQRLQEEDVVFDFTDTDEFTIRKKDGTTYLGANHEKITPQMFIDSTLAQNKILAVSEELSIQDNPELPEQPTTVRAGKNTPDGNNQTASINRRNYDNAVKSFSGKK